MYTYADESGHTGSNLLDASQPTYFAGALMARESLDAKYGDLFLKYAKSQGVDYLHAGELGMGKLIGFFPILEKLVRRDTLRFFLGNIDKKWFIKIKLFDVVFDPHENRGAYYHIYWTAPLRYLMLLKLSYIIIDDDLADIWSSIISTDYKAALPKLCATMTRIAGRVDRLPDKRSRQIISEAFNWASAHPDELGIKLNKKKLILYHYPNVAILTPLIGAVQRQAEFWKIKPKEIKHDQSSQFQSAWRELHKTLTNATDVEFGLIGGLNQKIGIDKNSQFTIGNSKTSAGIQFIDIILWLLKKISEGKELPPEAEHFMSRVFKHSEPYEISYNMTVKLTEDTMAPVMQRELTNEDVEKGNALLAKLEEIRTAKMAE